MSTPPAMAAPVIKVPMIKVLTVTSPNYAPLFDVFKASLLSNATDVDLRVLELDLSAFGGVYGFKTDSWYHSIEEKLRFVTRMLGSTSCEEDEYVVVCDADIQFFPVAEVGKDAESEKGKEKESGLRGLVAMAREQGLDYFGMPENHVKGSYNGGFYIIRNCPAVRSFFQNVLEAILIKRTGLADQIVINDTIHASGLRHAQIPHEFFVWGQGIHKADRTKAVFHHAVCEGSVDGKARQMAFVRNWIGKGE